MHAVGWPNYVEGSKLTSRFHAKSKSTTVGQPSPAIKSEGPEAKDPLFYDGDSETDIEFFAHRGPAGPGMLVNLDPQIHRADIERFVQFGFDEQVNRLAIRSGFQVETVQDIYKQVTCFKRLKQVIKAMRASALDRAKAEIEAQEREDLYAQWAGEAGYQSEAKVCEHTIWHVHKFICSLFNNI